MSDPIGKTGNMPTTPTDPVTSTGTEPVDSEQTVTGGFRAENTLSQTEGEAEGSENPPSGVSLDTPEEVTLGSDSLLDQALKSRLEGFRSTISVFNAHFSSDQIDLSSMRTLLLVLRGMIADLKALNRAENIDSASTERQNYQAQSAKISEIQIEIAKNQTVIDTKESDLLDKQQALSSKKNVDTNGMTDSEKKQLQSEIDRLEVHVGFLSGEITLLKSQNLKLQTEVAARQVSLALAENTEFVIKALVVVATAGNEKEERKTGEEKLNKLKRELQDLIALFSKEELQVKLAKDIQRDFNRKARELDSYFENPQQQSGGIAAELKRLLTPQLISKLYDVFSAASVAAALSNKAVPTEQQQADKAEGLALILLAEPPPVTASEENPVDQPYLGDSLSLEGANNPQAFTLLLLKERLADILKALSKTSLDESTSKKPLDESTSKKPLDESTSKKPLDESTSKKPLDESTSKTTTLDEAISKVASLKEDFDDTVVDTPAEAANQLAQLLELERDVDTMVLETLKDKEKAEAFISRSKSV